MGAVKFGGGAPIGGVKDILAEVMACNLCGNIVADSK